VEKAEEKTARGALSLGVAKVFRGGNAERPLDDKKLEKDRLWDGSLGRK